MSISALEAYRLAFLPGAMEGFEKGVGRDLIIKFPKFVALTDSIKTIKGFRNVLYIEIALTSIVAIGAYYTNNPNKRDIAASGTLIGALLSAATFRSLSCSALNLKQSLELFKDDTET